MHIQTASRDPASRGDAHGASRRALLGSGLLALSGLAGLTGCASAPPPAALDASPVALPDGWREPLAGAQDGHVVGSAWWKDFGSSELDALIRSALDANRDLKITAARVAQARALLGGEEAARRPQLGAVAGAQRGRDTAGDPKTERASLGLRASWEVDVFGRGAMAIDAARGDLRGAALALSAARITLAADVAAAYFELRALAHRVALGRDATALAQRQLEVARRKFDAGSATVLDIERWQAELAQERATTVQLEGGLRVRQRQLALLLGSSQAPVLSLQETPVPQPPAPVLPGELLERRPDVQRQARSLDAALARVGMARREVYPRLQIDWAGSRERLALSGGSASPQAVVGYGVSVTLPLLDGGRIRANIAVQEARAQEAMAEYEKAMLAALTDVEAVLVQWSAAEASLLQWQEAQRAGEAAARRAERLFEAGMADLGLVLDARRAHLRAQDAVSQAEGVRWAAAVGLRRVFAGTV